MTMKATIIGTLDTTNKRQVKGFKEAWVEVFRGLQDAGGRSTVYLVMDADKAGSEGSLVIADMFLKAGLPVPLKLILPLGMDLTDFMKEGRTL